jgi:hypothetical protein
MPQIFDFSLALDRFAVGEISHRIIPLIDSLGSSPRAVYPESAVSRVASTVVLDFSPKPEVLFMAFSPRDTTRVRPFTWPGTAASNIVLVVCGEVKRIHDARPAR